MITLLIGENSFEIERELTRIADGFDGRAEKFDGANLALNQLPDLLMGVSLFATSRLVIIRDLSSNKQIWPVFGDWLPKISDDIQLVLVEPKPDKRTVTFKALKNSATVREFPAWSDRDIATAEKWAIDTAKNMGFSLDKKSAQTLVQRIGADQWGIFHALEKLSLTDEISPDVINNLIESSPLESVFNLLDSAIRGDKREVRKIITSIEQTDDVYKLSGLLSSQAFQLAAFVTAGPNDNPARDFAIHPFVASKLKSATKQVSKRDIARIIDILTEADNDMKLSRAEPWLLIERAMMKIASI